MIKSYIFAENTFLDKNEYKEPKFLKNKSHFLKFILSSGVGWKLKAPLCFF
jgi:hypothetical protein